MLHSMPCCIQCHFAENAILCSMPCCMQCHVAYIAMLHTLPYCIHCNVTYKAILHIMLCCIQCHVTYNVMFHNMSCWRQPPRSSYACIMRDFCEIYISRLALPLSPFVSLAKNKKRLLEKERNYSPFI